MKRLSEQRFEKTLSKIYQAALEPSLWSDVLLDIGSPLSADSGQFVTISKENPTASFDLFAGLDDSAYPEFHEFLAMGLAPRVDYSVHLAAGSVVTDYHHMREKQINRHPFYQEFCTKYPTYYYGGMILDQDPKRFTGIAALRAKRFGNLTDEEIAYLERLVPHLQRSVALMRNLGMKGALSGLITALENFAGGAVVIDYRGQVIDMNTNAVNIIARKDGISVRNKHLRLGDQIAQHQLELELRDITSASLTANRAPHRYIRAKSITSPSPYILNGSPVQIVADLFRDIAGIIFITDPHSQPKDIVALLMQIYQLTPSEAELVNYLCVGKRLKDYAEDYRVNIETPRYHLKNVFQKMNVSRQPELVSVVLKSLPRIED